MKRNTFLKTLTGTVLALPHFSTGGFRAHAANSDQQENTTPGMQIILTSVMVNDQAKALKFYTEILGFVKKQDLPVDGENRWLTVVPSDAPDGVELLLEPTGFDFAKTYQKALFDAGIPLTSFGVANVDAEYERLKALGVKFKGEPMQPEGAPRMAVFDDTCGNYLMIIEQ